MLWGIVLFYGSVMGYIERSFLLSSRLTCIINIIGILLLTACVILTVYYVFRLKQLVKTCNRNILLFVWISFFVGLVLVNLIQYNVLESINFELQHSIFMVLTAIAVSTSGAILQSRLVILGGAIFGLLALIASYFPLEDQLLIESIGWTIAFIIPGIARFFKN